MTSKRPVRWAKSPTRLNHLVNGARSRSSPRRASQLPSLPKRKGPRSRSTFRRGSRSAKSPSPPRHNNKGPRSKSPSKSRKDTADRPDEAMNKPPYNKVDADFNIKVHLYNIQDGQLNRQRREYMDEVFSTSERVDKVVEDCNNLYVCPTEYLQTLQELYEETGEEPSNFFQYYLRDAHMPRHIKKDNVYRQKLAKSSDIVSIPAKHMQRMGDEIMRLQQIVCDQVTLRMEKFMEDCKLRIEMLADVSGWLEGQHSILHEHLKDLYEAHGFFEDNDEISLYRQLSYFMQYLGKAVQQTRTLSFQLFWSGRASREKASSAKKSMKKAMKTIKLTSSQVPSAGVMFKNRGKFGWAVKKVSDILSFCNQMTNNVKTQNTLQCGIELFGNMMEVIDQNFGRMESCDQNMATLHKKLAESCKVLEESSSKLAHVKSEHHELAKTHRKLTQHLSQVLVENEVLERKLDHLGTMLSELSEDKPLGQELSPLPETSESHLSDSLGTERADQAERMDIYRSRKRSQREEGTLVDVKGEVEFYKDAVCHLKFKIDRLKNYAAAIEKDIGAVAGDVKRYQCSSADEITKQALEKAEDLIKQRRVTQTEHLIMPPSLSHVALLPITSVHSTDIEERASVQGITGKIESMDTGTEESMSKKDKVVPKKEAPHTHREQSEALSVSTSLTSMSTQPIAQTLKALSYSDESMQQTETDFKMSETVQSESGFVYDKEAHKIATESKTTPSDDKEAVVKVTLSKTTPSDDREAVVKAMPSKTKPSDDREAVVNATPSKTKPSDDREAVVKATPSKTKPSDDREAVVKAMPSKTKPSDDKEALVKAMVSQVKPSDDKEALVKAIMSKTTPSDANEALLKAVMSQTTPSDDNEALLKAIISETTPSDDKEALIKAIMSKTPSDNKEALIKAIMSKTTPLDDKEALLKVMMSQAKPSDVKESLVKVMSKATPSDDKEALVKVVVSQKTHSGDTETISMTKPSKGMRPDVREAFAKAESSLPMLSDEKEAPEMADSDHIEALVLPTLSSSIVMQDGAIWVPAVSSSTKESFTELKSGSQIHAAKTSQEMLRRAGQNDKGKIEQNPAISTMAGRVQVQPKPVPKDPEFMTKSFMKKDKGPAREHVLKAGEERKIQDVTQRGDTGVEDTEDTMKTRDQLKRRGTIKTVISSKPKREPQIKMKVISKTKEGVSPKEPPTPKYTRKMEDTAKQIAEEASPRAVKQESATSKTYATEDTRVADDSDRNEVLKQLTPKTQDQDFPSVSEIQNSPSKEEKPDDSLQINTQQTKPLSPKKELPISKEEHDSLDVAMQSKRPPSREKLSASKDEKADDLLQISLQTKRPSSKEKSFVSKEKKADDIGMQTKRLTSKEKRTGSLEPDGDLLHITSHAKRPSSAEKPFVSQEQQEEKCLRTMTTHGILASDEDITTTSHCTCPFCRKYGPTHLSGMEEFVASQSAHSIEDQELVAELSAHSMEDKTLLTAKSIRSREDKDRVSSQSSLSMSVEFMETVVVKKEQYQEIRAACLKIHHQFLSLGLKLSLIFENHNLKDIADSVKQAHDSLATLINDEQYDVVQGLANAVENYFKQIQSLIKKALSGIDTKKAEEKIIKMRQEKILELNQKTAALQTKQNILEEQYCSLWFMHLCLCEAVLNKRHNKPYALVPKEADFNETPVTAAENSLKLPKGIIRKNSAILTEAFQNNKISEKCLEKGSECLDALSTVYNGHLPFLARLFVVGHRICSIESLTNEQCKEHADDPVRCQKWKTWCLLVSEQLQCQFRSILLELNNWRQEKPQIIFKAWFLFNQILHETGVKLICPQPRLSSADETTRNYFSKTNRELTKKKSTPIVTPDNFQEMVLLGKLPASFTMRSSLGCGSDTTLHLDSRQSVASAVSSLGFAVVKKSSPTTSSRANDKLQDTLINNQPPQRMVFDRSECIEESLAEVSDELSW